MRKSKLKRVVFADGTDVIAFIDGLPTDRGGETMESVTVTYTREEALACITALDRVKPYGWRDDALKTLEVAYYKKWPKYSPVIR